MGTQWTVGTIGAVGTMGTLWTVGTKESIGTMGNGKKFIPRVLYWLWGIMKWS